MGCGMKFNENLPNKANAAASNLERLASQEEISIVEKIISSKLSVKPFEHWDKFNLSIKEWETLLKIVCMSYFDVIRIVAKSTDYSEACNAHNGVAYYSYELLNALCRYECLREHRLTDVVEIVEDLEFIEKLEKLKCLTSKSITPPEEYFSEEESQHHSKYPYIKNPLKLTPTEEKSLKKYQEKEQKILDGKQIIVEAPDHLSAASYFEIDGLYEAESGPVRFMRVYFHRLYLSGLGDSRKDRIFPNRTHSKQIGGKIKYEPGANRLPYLPHKEMENLCCILFEIVEPDISDGYLALYTGAEHKYLAEQKYREYQRTTIRARNKNLTKSRT